MGIRDNSSRSCSVVHDRFSPAFMLARAVRVGSNSGCVGSIESNMGYLFRSSPWSSGVDSGEYGGDNDSGAEGAGLGGAVPGVSFSSG